MDTTSTATQPAQTPATPTTTGHTPLPTLDKLAALPNTTAQSLNEPITPPLPHTNLNSPSAYFFGNYLNQMNGQMHTAHLQQQHQQQQQQQLPLNGQSFYFNNQFSSYHQPLGHHNHHHPMAPQPPLLPPPQNPYNHTTNDILFNKTNPNPNLLLPQTNGVYTTPTLNTLLQQPIHQQLLNAQPNQQAQQPLLKANNNNNINKKKKTSEKNSPKKPNNKTNFTISNISTYNSDAGSDSGDSRLSTQSPSNENSLVNGRISSSSSSSASSTSSSSSKSSTASKRGFKHSIDEITLQTNANVKTNKQQQETVIITNHNSIAVSNDPTHNKTIVTTATTDDINNRKQSTETDMELSTTTTTTTTTVVNEANMRIIDNNPSSSSSSSSSLTVPFFHNNHQQQPSPTNQANKCEYPSETRSGTPTPSSSSSSSSYHPQVNHTRPPSTNGQSSIHGNSMLPPPSPSAKTTNQAAVLSPTQVSQAVNQQHHPVTNGNQSITSFNHAQQNNRNSLPIGHHQQHMYNNNNYQQTTDPASPVSPIARTKPSGTHSKQSYTATTCPAENLLQIKRTPSSTDLNQTTTKSIDPDHHHQSPPTTTDDDGEKTTKPSESLHSPPNSRHTPTQATHHQHLPTSNVDDLSFHEDDTLLSSPSSTRASSPKHGHNVSGLGQHVGVTTGTVPTDVFTKLLDMGDEVERKQFVERLQTIWDEYNIQCRSLPNISKSPLDLFKLYCAVRDKAGFNEVTRLKLWKEVSNSLLIGPSATAAFNVKKKFVQMGLFHLECRYDRGGIDPLPLIADIDKSTTKKTSDSSAKQNANNNATNTGNKSDKKKSSKNNNSSITVPPPPQQPNANYGMDNPNASNNISQMQQTMQNALSYQHQQHAQQNIQQPMHNPSSNAPQQQPIGYNIPPQNFYAQQQQQQQQQSMQASAMQIKQSQPQQSQVPQYTAYMPQQPPQQANAYIQHAQQQYQQQQQQQQQQPPGKHYPDAIYNVPTAAQNPSQQQPQQQSNAQQHILNAQYQQPRYPASDMQRMQGVQPNVLQPGQYPGYTTQMQMQPPPPQPPQQPQQQLNGVAITQMPYQTPTPMQQHPQQAVFSNQQYSQQQQQLMQRQGQMDPKYLNNPANQTVQAQGSLLPVATPPPAPPPPLTMQQQQQPTGHLQRPQLVQTPPIQQQQQFSVPQQPITPLRFNNKVPQNNPTAAFNPGLHAQQQQQQYHAAHVQVQSKREPLFPPNSIEASVPNESKKRKITHKEITPCDPWKLFMCLKSGLLAESTWALDALNIFLYDDNTIGYFHLKHFPGLVNILLEYYVKCLQSIFADEFDFGCLPHKGHNNADNISQLTTVDRNSSICKSNSTTDDHVMKTHRVVFNDKESTKFFNVHRKVSKLADKAIFVKKLRTPDDETHTSKYNCQQLKDLVVDVTTTDDGTTDTCYYRTSFSTDDELTKTERLFYGPYYEQRCQMSMDKQTKNKTIDKHKPDTNDDNDDDNDDGHETNKKRKCQSNYEDQAHVDEDSLFTILSQKQDELMNRCMCISTILRNLSFVPGNDVELCKSALFVDVLSNLLLVKHKHNRKRTTTTNTHSNDTSECPNNNVHDQQPCTTSNHVNVLNDWWWDGVHILRENTLVTLTNLAAILNLNNYNETIIKRILNGLIHWSTCKSSDALDTLVTVSDTSCISPQRLCIETLSKMTVNDINVDLLLACATNEELDALFAVLGDWLVRRDEETLREFAIVLLTSVAKCDQLAARLISKYSSLLIAYLEDFEEQARILFLSSHHHHSQHHHHQQQHPQQFLNDDNLGTTADMLRRCANCLLSIAAIPDNLQVLLKHEHRLLDLITSQYVDSIVGQKLAEVLYCCSHESKQRSTQARQQQQQQQRVLIA